MKTLNFASEIYWPLVKASLFCLRPFFRTKKTTFARKEWKMVGLFQVERRLKNRNGFSVYKKTRKRFHCIWVSKSTNQFLFFKAQIREQMSGPEISYYTGCNSDIWKNVQVNILKEPLLVLKQTIHQRKALDFSFQKTPRKCLYL